MANNKVTAVEAVVNTKKPKDWSEPNLPENVFLANTLAYVVKLVDIKYDVDVQDFVVRLLVREKNEPAHRYCVKTQDSDIKNMFIDLHKTQDVNIALRDKAKSDLKKYGVMALKYITKDITEKDLIEKAEFYYQFIGFKTLLENNVPIESTAIEEEIAKSDLNIINELNEPSVKFIIPVINYSLDRIDIINNSSKEFEIKQILNAIDNYSKIDTYLVFNSSIGKCFYIDADLENKVY